MDADCLISYPNGLVLVDFRDAYSNLKSNIKIPYFNLKNDSIDDILKDLLKSINALFNGFLDGVS